MNSCRCDDRRSACDRALSCSKTTPRLASCATCSELHIDLAQLTMNFDRRYALCIQKLYHKPHFTAWWSFNKSLQLQLLQRCFSENSSSPASACFMWHYYSTTYMQSLHVINGLLAVGRVGNLLCGWPLSFIARNILSFGLSPVASVGQPSQIKYL